MCFNMPINKVAAIIPAAGRGSRMGLDTPKQFLTLAGLPVLVHTVRAFLNISIIDSILLAVPPDLRSRAEKMIDRYRLNQTPGKLLVVNGGRTRQDSVKACLESLPPAIEWVLVHDGARPLVNPELIEACLFEARQSGASMAGIPVSDTLKAVTAEKKIMKTVDRHQLWQAQTPQVAQAALLRKAYAAAERNGFCGTDEASLLEYINCPVTVVPGSEKNVKITRPEDLIIAEALLMHDEQHREPARAFLQDLRIGHGYDAHRLAKERPLVLGGVVVPHPLGLVGHSDADVLTHALCDAILGALGAGDIGKHFPDTDERFSGVHSLILLEQVVDMAGDMGFCLLNADITIVAEKPKLSAYFPEMMMNLAEACRVDQQCINIKATTTERMGFAGREEGIAAHAVVLMQKRK